MSKQTLEQKIAAALANANIGSADLTELVAEVEAALTTAEAAVKQEREQAIDLTVSPDATEAHQRVVATQLAYDRLKAVLPRLKARLSEAIADEIDARWRSRAGRVEEKANEAAAAFAEQYPKHTQALLDLFVRMSQINAEISSINSEAPAGVRHPRYPELVARGLPSFSADRPSILATVVLCDPSTGKAIWPPRQQPFSTTFTLQVPPHSGDRWHEDLAREQAARRREWDRVSEYYTEQERQRVEREVAETKVKVEQINRAKAAAIGIDAGLPQAADSRP